MSPLLKTFKSLCENRRLQGYIVLSVIITFCVTSAIVGAAIWGLNQTQFFETQWAEWLADLAGSVGAVVVGFIITPAIMPLISSFFEAPILKALEAEAASTEKATPTGTIVGGIAEDLRFMVLTILLNVLCLPLYFVPGVNIAVYYLLNGYLLGREFFTSVEANYSNKKFARKAFKAHKIKYFGNGVALAFIATLPIANWFLPVFALTLMFHTRQQNQLPESPNV